MGHLYLFLYNNSTITALLSTYTVGESTYPMIRNGIFLDPSWPVDSTCINIYYSSPTNLTEEFGTYRMTVNCWAKNETLSKGLSETVSSEISRYNVRAYYMTADVGLTIKQTDDREGYLTPVEVTIKTRTRPG